MHGQNTFSKITKILKGGAVVAVFFTSWFISLPAEAANYTVIKYEQFTGNLSNQTLTKDKSPYLVLGGCNNSYNKISGGYTFTVEAGVVVKFAPVGFCFNSNIKTRIDISGNFIVNGTADDPVIFTSWNDDAAGGDTNGDGNLSQPQPGDWAGLSIASSGSNNISINHAIIRYGGGGTFTSELAIGQNVNLLQLNNLELSYSGSFGLRTITSLAINQSSFHNNTSGAINADYFWNPPQVTAINSWWGDASGPTTFSNPGGKGQTFVGNVIYDPWVGKVTNHAPTISFSSDFSNGISTSTTFLPSQPTFKVVYSDSDNDAPVAINVVVNSTTYPMSIAQIVNYVSGTIYTFTAPTGTMPKGDYSFYFEASDGKVTTTLPSVGSLSFHVKNVPVILIPGILGTELVRGNETLWLDLGRTMATVGDEFMDPLAMNVDGSPVVKDISAADVIRQKDLAGRTVFYYFNGLIDQLTRAGYQENTDLFVFPYDWRLDNVYTAQKLREKIETVLNQTESSRVDLVTHSMGGLVAKQYITDNGYSKIDKLIFIGTPHLGSPDAAKTLLFGSNLGIEFVFSFLNELEIKKIAQNMPSIYQLLPSPAYFAKLGGYFYDLAIHKVFNYDETLAYLGVQGSNQSMLGQVATFHSSLDNLDLSKIRTYNIVGCKTETITKIIRRNSEAGGDEYYLNMQTGDGTVPLGSADLADFGGVKNFYVKNVVHSKMPSLDNVRQLVTEIVGGSVSSSSLPIDVQMTKDGCGGTGKLVSVHSPVDLHVYDAYGNHVGPTENGGLEQNIPGATYENIANNKFVFLPEDQGQTYTIKLNATATGTFSFRIQNIANDQTQQITYYNDIPIIPQSRGQIEVSASSSDTNLQFDANGTDNFVSITADSVLKAEESEDYVKPTTSIFIGGKAGNNGWYISTTTISLSATDDNSGILKIDYSLDNGNTWQLYSEPFAISQQGTSTILYQSIDRAGNKEEVQQTVVHIDVQPPEATIVFDPAKKDIAVAGEENLTSAAIDDLGGKIILTDEAGNSTTLNFVQKNRRESYKLELENILYNGIELKKLNKNKFNFEWEYKHNNLTELEQGISIKDDFRIKAEYNSRKDVTTIEGKDADGKKIKQKMDGLVLIKIKTYKGDLNYNY